MHHMSRRLSKLNFFLHNKKLRDEFDTSNFSDYPDSGNDIQALKPEKDPFINW